MTFWKWIGARPAIPAAMISGAAPIEDLPDDGTARPRAVCPPADFDACYEAHFDFVARSLRHLGVPDAALDDAAQEVFLVVHRRLAGFDHRASIRGWLFAIAINVARDHRRAARRKGGHAPLPEDVADRAPGPHDALARAEALRLLDALLAELDDDRRAVFLMVDYEQMTAPEAAAALGANVNTICAPPRGPAKFAAALARHRARTDDGLPDDARPSSATPAAPTSRRRPPRPRPRPPRRAAPPPRRRRPRPPPHRRPRPRRASPRRPSPPSPSPSRSLRACARRGPRGPPPRRTTASSPPPQPRAPRPRRPPHPRRRRRPSLRSTHPLRPWLAAALRRMCPRRVARPLLRPRWRPHRPSLWQWSRRPPPPQGRWPRSSTCSNARSSRSTSTAPPWR
ncbi:MAG: sigma-70 family RNA polymerase sigma factor [Polyangiales bacterium]